MGNWINHKKRQALWLLTSLQSSFGDHPRPCHFATPHSMAAVEGGRLAAVAFAAEVSLGFAAANAVGVEVVAAAWAALDPASDVPNVDVAVHCSVAGAYWARECDDFADLGLADGAKSVAVAFPEKDADNEWVAAVRYSAAGAREQRLALEAWTLGWEQGHQAELQLSELQAVELQVLAELALADSEVLWAEERPAVRRALGQQAAAFRFS